MAAIMLATCFSAVLLFATRAHSFTSSQTLHSSSSSVPFCNSKTDLKVVLVRLEELSSVPMRAAVERVRFLLSKGKIA
jgi:hypothetical protein